VENVEIYVYFAKLAKHFSLYRNKRIPMISLSGVTSNKHCV